jgi:pilus assembly protein CpaD
MSLNPAPRLLKASSLGAICFAAAAMISLAGCTTDSLATGPMSIDDYHDRHPILLISAPTTLDVFPVGEGKLDPGSVDDIKGFAARYQAMGSGRIVILAPSVGGARKSVDEVRRVLASSGLHGLIGLGSYRVGDPSLASPIRLSFRGVKAEEATRCGRWPDDLASGGSTDGWSNESYWNFGCATQSMLAAQVDDPRDFARARTLGPSDVQMRLRAINDVRNGTDPGTAWAVQLTPIGQVGGN